MSYDAISQVAIAALGGAAIYLVGSPSPRLRAVGCALGLASQPFWLYATAVAGQWGIFALAWWYAFSWARALRMNWKAA